MALIEEFIARYRKEYDFYDQTARLAAQTLELALQSAGIRSIVTYRAKALVRLEAKCRQRAPLKNYASVDDIYRDIVDLAGVRVALYFPGERDQVDRFIKQLFVVTTAPKEFPDGATPAYTKRFSGYSAIHYRVQLREAALSEAHKRYAEARIEIQVASVLMHAWAEVEHDLVYKPSEGTLSEDEYGILDELNGVVMAGEISLERLQKAGEARVAAGGRKFTNHYDLAAHILSRTTGLLGGPLADSVLGRVDLLFKLLTRLDLASPDQIKQHLNAVRLDTERRPIAEQIIDRFLAEDDARYKIYEEVRASDRAERFAGPEMQAAIGFFLTQWTEFERLLSRLEPQIEPRRILWASSDLLARLGLDQESCADVERIRRLRTRLVHGPLEAPDSADLWEAAHRLQNILARLTGGSNDAI